MGFILVGCLGGVVYFILVGFLFVVLVGWFVVLKLLFPVNMLREGQKRNTHYPKQTIKVTDSVMYTNFIPKLQKQEGETTAGLLFFFF